MLLAVSPILKRSSWLSRRGFWYRDPKSQNMPTSFTPFSTARSTLDVHLQHSGHDFQMKALRVRMTSGSGRPFSRTQREAFENSEAGTLGKKNARNSEADVTEGNSLKVNVTQYASVARQSNPQFGTARASELCVLA